MAVTGIKTFLKGFPRMEFYSSFALFYDDFIKDVDYKSRADYFNKIISSYIGEHGLLLDLACGTGTLSIELSKLGYEVIGVDASVEMLSLAREKAFEQNAEILFLNQRMEELDLYGTVDCCVCALDSLNHLTDIKLFEKAVALVSLYLNQGGIFIFDLNSEYKHNNILADNCFVFENEDKMVIWRNNTAGNLTEITLDLFAKNKGNQWSRFSEEFSERAYSVSEVKEVIAKSGLELLAVYEGDTFSKPGEECERLIFVTRKDKTDGQTC